MVKRRIKIILLSLIVLTILSSYMTIEVTAESSNLNPVADTFIDEWGAWDEGDAMTFSPQVVNWVGTDESVPSTDAQSAIKFNLSSLMGIVTHAQLGIHVVEAYGTISLNIFSNTDDWVETTDKIPLCDPPPINSDTITSADNDSWKYYDVTSFVSNQNAGNKLATFVLTGNTSGINQFAYNSREDSTNPPKLNITYISSTFSPLDNATNMDVNGNLKITFSSSVLVGTGNITIKKSSDDSVIETISVTGPKVTVSGATEITINPATTLEEVTEYYVLIDATAFQDSSGNKFSGINDKTTWNFTTKDLTPPTVSSINRQNPAQEVTNATSVTYRVTFSENVSGVDTTDFTLSMNGASGTIASISGSEATYDVTVNSVSGNGSLRLDLKSSGTGITDTTGNPISGGFTNGQTYTIDTIAPTVSSINRHSPAQAATNAANITYRVTFSESVSGVDISDFTLSADGASGTIASISGGDITYDVTVNSVGGNGTLRLDLKDSGTGITDSVGNPINDGFTSGQTYTIDKIGPSVSSIARQNPLQETTTAASVTYRVTFNEDVSGVDITDFTLITTGETSGTIASISEDGAIYNVTINEISGNGTLRLDLKDSGTEITDIAGNAISGGFTGGETYTIDQTIPFVCSINRQSPSGPLTNASSVIYRVTFSESVSGVDIPDFTLTATGTVSGTVASVSGSGATYDVTVNAINGNGTLRLDLNNSGTGIIDSDSNPITDGYTSGEIYTIDKTSPTVTLTDNDADHIVKQGNSVTITAAFNEDMANSPTITITNGGVTGAIMTDSGNHRTWTYAWTVPAGNASATVTVAGSDLAGNTYSGTNNIVFTIDNTSPTAASLSPADNAVNVALNSNLTITFNENVNIGSGNITIHKTADDSITETIAVTSGQVTGGGGDTITVNPLSTLAGETGYYVKIAATAFSDAAGNYFTGINDKTTWNFTTADITSPSVQSVSLPVSGTYLIGQNLDFTVNFSEAVTVNTTGGIPYIPLTLNTGGEVKASYLNGAGTTALVFRYTVKTGDQDLDGITLGGAITANGGTIRDNAGNNAALTLNGVGATTGIKINGIAPGITFIKPVNLSTVNISTGSTVIVNIIDNGTEINTDSIKLKIDNGDWVEPTALIANAQGYTLYYIITNIDYTNISHTVEVTVTNVAGNSATGTVSFNMEVRRNGFGFGKLRFE